ncbi:Testicular acid phosphatase-like protein [Aphelenchoides fujianensis]|nr:Testicular acid phosphatase-like protein [Aphelenchoides fujianensis]
MLRALAAVWFLVAVLPADGAGGLRFVQAIWRHGDRAPGGLPYPKDPHDEAVWPRGWEQLTNLGMQQMKELGAFFRQRYAPAFINGTYNYREVYVRSSDSPRALTSAQSFLNGLFPPLPADGFESGLLWQPIPVHASEPKFDDPLLKPTSFDCPTYENASDRLNGALLAQLEREYADLIHFLADVTGYGPNITLHQVAKLHDINRELKHNLSQPEWVFRKWPQHGGRTTLELVTELRRLERTAQFNKPELARLRGGFLLADWLRRARDVAAGKQRKPSKMLLYSSHDGTLLALLYAMGIADHQQVPYAAALIMEVHEREEGGHFVRLFYHHDGALEPKRLPNCEVDCELTKFASLLEPSAVHTREALDELCEVKTLKKAVELEDLKCSSPRIFPPFLLLLLFTYFFWN